MTPLWNRLVTLLRRGRAEREMSREIASHLALLEEEHLRRGLPAAEARAAALRSYGSPAQAREMHREARGFPRLETVLQDLRYGARGLLRTPAFTLVAVLTLALGIGANTAVFSVLYAVLLRPLAYHDADRLVTVLHYGNSPVSAANFLDWRQQSHTLEALAAAEFWSPNLSGIDSPEHVRGHRMTRNLLPVLGVAPALGRWFLAGDDRGGDDHEVILSHSLWERRFGSRREVLGTAILLNGDPYTVVGVMPREFAFSPFWATRGELWIPMRFGDRALNRGGNSLRLFGRLKPGVTLSEARAEIAGITARLEQQYPGTNREVVVTPLKENVVGQVETPLRILLGAVGFVLLIACGNVAHMLLARTAARQREMAVRSALGAGRGRLVAQMLTESLLLAALGGLAGLGIAYAGVRALIALSPASLPRVETIGVDGPVIAFLAGVTALTTLLFGLLPAWQTGGGPVAEALKEGGRSGSEGVGRSRLRGFLVASEFMLAFLLLMGAGLMVRSFLALQAIDPGFSPRGVLSLVVSVSGTGQAAPGRRAGFYQEVLDRVRALPGVESAGGINHLPLVGDLWGWNFLIEGRPRPRPGEFPTSAYRLAFPGYFETMRLTVVRGRGIEARDDGRAPAVVVINERAAAAYWPGQDPLGQRIAFETGAGETPRWATVIGIVRNARQLDWSSEPFPETYLAAFQNERFLTNIEPHDAYMTVVLRTRGNPADMAPAVKQAIWSIDRNLPISQVITMTEAAAAATAQPRFEMLLFTLFAGVAVVLAAVGIYGVMSYAVTRRTQEIGIRMSLGARASDVRWLVLRQGMTQALAGAAAGIAASLLLSRLLASLLYGVRPTDPVALAGAIGLLTIIALLATWIPSRKATRIDPVIALRAE